MAQRYLALERESRNIKYWIYDRQIIAEKWRLTEFKATVKIQSWFRGTRLRCYLKVLKEKAIIIQKYWRGVLGRKAYLNQLKAIVRLQALMYYNKKATLLQKVFRGWYARSHIFDFYVWKNYFEIIGQQNEALRKQVENYWSCDRNPKVLENERLLKVLKYENKKKHYLLSTDADKGIYYQKNHPDFAQIEKWIKRMKPPVKGERIDKIKRFPLLKKFNPSKCPIPPQGPFKSPQQIFNLKNRPIIPLRMEDDVEGARKILEHEKMLEEGLWIHKKPFNIKDSKPCPAKDYSIFFSTMHKDHNPARIKVTRPDRKTREKDFIVPPIPVPIAKIFEQKFGDYSDVL